MSVGMKTSEKIELISAALSRAQGEMRNPEKNRTATIPMKSGGKYCFNYADLPRSYDTVREVLSKNELAHNSTVGFDDKGPVLYSRLLHSSGQWFESSWLLPANDDMKVMAGFLTYAKRYLFNGLVGIHGDEDTDGPPEDGSDHRDKKPPPIFVESPPQAPIGSIVPRRTPSIAQLQLLESLVTERNIPHEAVKSYISHRFKDDRMQPVKMPKFLSLDQFNDLILAIKENRIVVEPGWDG